ncbi:MAG: hypothetical protein AABY97_00980 [Chloroflexota bacterium]
MAESALAKKMTLRPGSRVAILNAPEGYRKELASLPKDVELVGQLRGKFDWIQLFVRTRTELEASAPRAIAALKPESVLWISFPKGSSKIQTDLTRDKGWESLRTVDLKWVNLISVNDTWSAFALRPYKPGESKQKLPWA